VNFADPSITSRFSMTPIKRSPIVVKELGAM